MPSPRGSRPNIVLIMADDLGYSDIGCFGSEIQTPNLDRLAAGGVRFTNFYNNAVCVPTRASLLTGLYPHQVLSGRGGGLLTSNNVTIAELLRDAGYRTLMAGKWHNGYWPDATPVARGFDRYWGLLSGCSNYFNPGEQRPGEPAPAHKLSGDMRRWGDQDRVMFPYTPEERDFYTTDVFSDKAITFLEEHGTSEQPFFLYLAECAPHFPMHAWPEDIARVGDRYRIGWDEVRRRRAARLQEERLIEPRWGVSPRDDRAPAWDDEPDQAGRAHAMAVYAAMVERMDFAIGRVLDKIRALGKEQDTLVLFLSDNGAAAQAIHNTPDVPPGPVDSYHTIDAPWANASNTPFRLYKVFDHEGGISTPLIASWPRMMTQGGAIDRTVGHVLDFLPSFAELAGVDVPTEFDGHPVLAPEGRSLATQLTGQRPSTELADEDLVLCWEFSGCRAIRHGRWKLVSQGAPRQHAGMTIDVAADSWELYDIHADRCEGTDLVDLHPDIASRLEGDWQNWLRRCAAEAASAGAVTAARGNR